MVLTGIAMLVVLCDLIVTSSIFFVSIWYTVYYDDSSRDIWKIILTLRESIYNDVDYS